MRVVELVATVSKPSKGVRITETRTTVQLIPDQSPALVEAVDTGMDVRIDAATRWDVGEVLHSLPGDDDGIQQIEIRTVTDSAGHITCRVDGEPALHRARN